jgi:hypothetical protein
MKQLMKSILRTAWRTTSPIRAHVMARLDRRVVALIQAGVNSPLQPILENCRRTSGEIDIVLSTVIRELVRLQSRVESLEESLTRSEKTDLDAPTLNPHAE